ncbi:TipJ family phage tail tip protein [Klebsiella michiganensis]|uniref:TipJ family phage tail tip protein n=3 Tax=Klebsiella TaxID=570 RepID=UPI0018912BCC
MTQHLIKGCKSGSSSPRTPTEQPDDLQSVAKAKILIALGEGEFAGALTAKDIYLDGTPLENSDGSQNFSGVAWEFRPGTQAQNYIQGIPGSENEINVGVEVSSKTAWSRSFSNTQLSAVRLRLKWPSLLKQEDNGDLVGNAVSYAVDLQTDGGSWQTVLESAVSGKTTSGYERCHRIDLPRATMGWVLRLRKVTEDANTSKTGDVMMLQSYAEVLDAKLRYPNTALLYVEFDSRQFNGSIPKIACSPRGRVIRVPDNYDPETRQYSGIWTGAFKWAWTDNPAWIFYDLIVSDRFGLGNRLTSENIDKWTLYQVARYCDEPVPDGKGGEGTEPRYLCNVYVQDRNDAYTVLRDFAAIFRGMTCWSGDRVIALADMPRDIDYTYTRANVINGRFHYASSSSKTRYTNALVSWSDPENEYADAMEPVFEQPLVARYGFNQLELTAIGCTRQSEANRKGRWGILTNNKDRVVTFSVGLDGNIPQPGYIIAVADEMLAGKVNGGRTREVDGCVITLDRKTEAKAGDRLLLNLPSGGTQGRTIESVDGHVVTVTAEYAERPEPECVWAIESDSLRVQQYRVVGVKDNNDSTFTISAAAHDPDKYARIDSGAIIDSRPISVIPPGKQSAPANIVVESYSVVNQGISVETLQVHWTAVKNAIAYEAQWRRNEGNWINVPRSSVASFDVSGIYAGRYIVRVRAINAAEVSSGWAYSQEKTLTGKIGLPSAPVSLTTTSLLHGVQLNWAFPEGSGDTQKTELQYSPNPTGNGAMALSDVTYPGNSYQQMGLQIAATFWYRARIVDRLGNESPWTVWVQGMASDDIGEYYDKLTDAIKDTEAWHESQRDMEETHKTLTETADAIREEVEQQVNEINQSINETAGGIRKQVDGQIATVNKSITENIDLVNQTLNDAISTVNKSINDAVSDINTSVDQQIADVNKALTAGDSALKSQLQTVENGLKQSIAQANTGWDKAVKQETADRIADVNAKAAQAADQLLNEKNERLASIESTQQIIQDINNSLATQMAQISAGTGEQFDSQAIWYFDNDREGWTSNGGIPSVIENGWLRPTNHATDAYITSPVISISGKAYRFLKLRLKKTGTPVWSGQVRWRYEGQTFNDSRMLTVAEPDYDGSGRAVLSIQDIPWGGADDKPVIQFRLDLTLDQSDENFITIDWIAVGRPTPGASTAALRQEATTRANADAVEATKRATLAAQIRGTSESNDLADLSSGLLFQEMNARITADKAEVTARESLQTQFNDNKSSVAEELSSLTTAQSAQASKISGLEISLGKKADATALQTLTQKVEQQGTTLTSQGNTLTSLSNRIGKTESGVAANSNAITGLQSTVSQQEDKLTSQGLSLTKLTNDLSATNANVNKKADASALQTLQNTITQQGGALTTQGSAIVSLENSLNALDVGGANQIPDSGSLVRYGNVSTDKYNGNGVMAFTLKAGAAYRDLISINLSAPVDGTEYVLSFYAKAAINGQKVRSHFYSPNSTKKAVSSQGNTFTNSDGLCDFTLTTEWQRYWVKWTQGAGTGSKKLIVARIQQGSTDQTVYLSSPKFERGNVPTAWSEAPEDNASAAAVSALTSRVDSAEGVLTSQGQLLTSLQNGLTTADQNIGKKADSSAVNTLTNRVSQVENTLTTQSESITSLSGNISTLRNQVSNPWFDGSLESYVDGQQISGSGAIVTTAQKFNGSRSLRLRREANNGGNSDKQIGPWSSIRENAVYSVELWAMMPADQSPSTGWQTIVGIQGQNAAGQNSWQGAVTITESGLGERGKWVKFSGKALMNGTGRTRGVVWISTRGATGSGTPGYDLYIDDIVITDITDAQAVQTTADATASAVDSLTTKVSQQDNNISSIGNRTTVLENGLSVTNASVNKKADANTVQTLQNTVTQQGKDLSSQGNAITSLNNMVSSVKDDISKKADTAAVFALTNRVTETEQSIRSNSDAVTSLSSSLSQQARRGANVLPDGTWESYPVGYNVANNRVLVTSDEAYSGAKCIRLIRANDYNATATDNNDCHIFAGLQIRDGATYYVEFRVKPDPKGTAMADNVQLSVGFSLQDMSGSWSWPALTKAKKDLVAEGWTKVSGYLTNNRTSIKQAMVRLSVPNVSTVKAGNAFLIDDLFITEVTDAKAALDAADANALAIMNLKTTVTQNGEDITSQGSSITKLTNDLAITNGNVNKKADATALQTLQNTVTQQGKEAASQGTALTSLENSLNGLSVGGANLIRHSDTLDGWSSRSPSETYQGASVAWTRLVKGTGGYVQLDEQTLDVTGKTEFIYSFYAKGAYAAQEMTAYFYNPSNTSRIETNQGYKSSAGDGAAQFTLTTSWQRYWVRWVIPATAGTKRLIPARLQHAPSADKEVWLCRPKLETGNVVTDWTPNNDDIAAEIQANAGAVQNLSTRVTTAEGKITSSGTAITRLQNDLALTQADVSKKADTTSLQTVQNSVTQQDKDITAANSAITKLTSDLSTTNANVSKKADASALQTLQNTITQQGETLTTQGSAIVSLENSLNALDVGGANQIPDSGSLVRYGNVSTDKYNGNGVMAFTLKAGAAYRDLISINLSAPVDGTEYVLSFYAKAAINGQKVRSHFYSPNSTKKAVSSQGNTFTNSDGLCDFTLTTEWQRYWVKWTQGAGTGSKKLIVARIQQGSTDQTVYLSSPKFERGNVPTAWSEAPEDNASAAAVSALTSRVDSAEGVLTSQGQLLTSLQNGLTTADQNIGKKADSSAVNTLTNRVSQVENTLTTQSESITSLSGNISTLRNQVSNPWFDGSLESYADGQQISGSGAIVTTAQKFNGSRSLRLRREANNGGNSDKQIGPWSSIRENAVYSVELWAMMPADQSPSTGWQTIVGIQGQNAAGQNSWQGAVTITESGLGERGKWVKFSGKALMNGTGRTRGVVWISTRGATGSGTPGYDLYIDDIVITDVTDAQTALDVADASTTAVSGLTTRVTNAETKITAHSQQITSLQSSLSGKADAGALNTLSSRVTSAEGKIESTASGLTSLNSTVGSLSSTVQAQGQTLSDTNGKVNSTYSIKVETNNGKKVGAGIVLGSDGSTSDMILYADRFSLFNRNSKAAVPVMIAEGNDLYIDSARIKNGTIDIAKITDRLSSTNYVAGWRGWSITKSGSSEFNNVVVRGEIQADTGTLNNVVINESCNILGTVRANKIIGDVGSWAINIAQHRSRRIAKAQWAWFDLLAVDRQPFEQRVQLLGALRQDDSINITGGGKLTAGMEYKSYEGGSLSMGKLGYCILMLGTGDTSGGGPMTCALSIDGVLYKQENGSMEIQSMDFIVPPGTGQTVVRYGYYLDRNGGMTGVILSRFHAFVMRNSNIIRGVSSD